MQGRIRTGLLLRQDLLQWFLEGIGAGLAVALGQPLLVAGVVECGDSGGVGKGIAHPAQRVQGLLQGWIDQAEPLGQGDAGGKGAQWSVGVKEGFAAR